MAAAAATGAREDEGEARPAGEEGEGGPDGGDAVAARGERSGGGEAAGAPRP